MTTQWEYCKVSWDGTPIITFYEKPPRRLVLSDYMNPEDEFIKPKVGNLFKGEPWPNSEQARLIDYIRVLGNEGWELVGAGTEGGGGNLGNWHDLYFKRQKSKSGE